MERFRFYKESNGNWYVDLPKWTGSKADLEMVSGADTMLEYMAEGNVEVHAYISENEFDNSDVLKLKGLAEDVGSGAYYIMDKYKGIDLNLNIWLCDVTIFVFGKFPDKIYISKSH
jgi:hypothetical protein